MKFLHLLMRFCTLLGLVGLITIAGCGEDTVESNNSGPIIDSIVTDPAYINPGSEIVLKAFATDPEGDSIGFAWSTYSLAGFFSDSAAPVCTMLVNKVLEGGMKMKVDLIAFDNDNRTKDSIWINLVPGENINGYIYHSKTRLPVAGAIVGIRKNIDTTNFNGYFELNNIAQGEAPLSVQSPYCNGDTFNVEIYDGLLFETSISCPELTHAVNGNILTDEGDPLGGVEVMILNKDSSATELADTTDEAGYFEIESVPVGTRIFSITEINNVPYDILPETLSVSLNDSLLLSITGHVKRSLFEYNNISDSLLWNLSGSGHWNTWRVNPGFDCIYYNSCETPGLTELLMASPVAIPEDAVKIGWRARISLTNLICYMIYKADGTEGDGYSFPANSPDTSFEEVVDMGSVNPVGTNFDISFFALSLGDGGCSSACLKNFEIFYYK